MLGSWCSGVNAFLFCLLKYRRATKMSAASRKPHHCVGWSLRMLLVLDLEEKTFLLIAVQGPMCSPTC